MLSVVVLTEAAHKPNDNDGMHKVILFRLERPTRKSRFQLFKRLFECEFFPIGFAPIFYRWASHLIRS